MSPPRKVMKKIKKKSFKVKIAMETVTSRLSPFLSTRVIEQGFPSFFTLAELNNSLLRSGQFGHQQQQSGQGISARLSSRHSGLLKLPNRGSFVNEEAREGLC